MVHVHSQHRPSQLNFTCFKYDMYVLIYSTRMVTCTSSYMQLSGMIVHNLLQYSILQIQIPMRGYTHFLLCACTYRCYLGETVPENLLFLMTPAKPGVPEAAPQLLPLSLTANQWPDLDLLLLSALLLRPTKQPTFHRVNQRLQDIIIIDIIIHYANCYNCTSTV